MQHPIITKPYGSAHAYESAASLTIGQANQYYAIAGVMSAGKEFGITFSAGSSDGGSAAITTAGGTAINIADTGHGLVSGDYVAVQSANHNGLAEVTYVDADNFTVPIAHVGDESCTWQQGDYLEIGEGAAGTYFATFSVTAAGAAAAKTFKFEIAKNDIETDESAFEITTSGTSHQSGSNQCLCDFAEGDRVYIILENETDTSNLDYEHCGLILMRVS